MTRARWSCPRRCSRSAPAPSRGAWRPPGPRGRAARGRRSRRRSGHTTRHPRLVLGCIDADFRVQIRIFQHFSRSTRKSSSSFLYCFFFFLFFSRRGFFSAFLTIYKKIIFSQEDFAQICKMCLREDDILVDLEKCCKMRIWTPKSASIQRRTDRPKLGVQNADWAVGTCS